MASSAEETQRMRDAAMEARENFQAISDILSKNLATTKASADVMARINTNLKGQLSIEDQLEILQREKTEYLEEYLKSGKIINEDLVKRLDLSIDLLEKEKERIDNAVELQNLKNEFNSSLKDALGLNNEYVKAFKVGGAAALGFVAMKKAVEFISSNLGSLVDLGKELYTDFGLSAGESAEIALQTAAASVSIEGMLYGTEAMAAAAKDSVEYFGTISNLTMDSQKNIATLNKLGVESSKSVQLDKIFKDASGDGKDLTDSIKVIAKKEGVTAKKLFEGMADDMSRLVGATEDEIKAMAKTNAQLIKRGLTMRELEDISNNVLSVEESMRAEAKARAFIGRDINANGVRQAALALQTATTEEGRNAAMLDMSRILQDQVGSAEDFNNMSIKQRQLFAEAYGMSVDGITEMLTKQEKFNEYQKEYNGLSDEDILNKIEADEKQQAILSGIIDSGKEMGSLSMAMIPALASAKELGVNFGGIGGKIKDTVTGAGNLLKKLYEMTAGKLLGKLGGIGESLGGVGAGKTPKTPKIVPDSGKGMGGMTGAIEKIDAKKLLAGGAALVLVAASVFIFAKAVQEFTEVGWKEVGMAIVSMVALVGALALIGAIMSSGVGAVAILAGAAAMIVIAGAMYVLGKAIQEIATGFGMMGELTTQLTALVMITPGLMKLAGVFAILGASMIPLALGLALITPFIGTLAVLGTMLPLINNSLNGGTDSESDTSNSDNKSDTMLDLLTEIKGLRQDLQAQPIMVNVDGKVVSRISRVQSRQSVSKNGYGG